jgi:hypothetical protein
MANTDEAKIIAQGILSFTGPLFEPQASKTIDKNTGKPKMKYGCTVVLVDEAATKALKTEYLKAVYAKFGEDKGKQLIKDQELKSPFLTKKLEKYGYPEGSCYIRVSSTKKPGIVADYRDPATGKPAKILDPERVYSGVHAKATLRLFWYDSDGNKGFSFGLNNIQRLTRKDGNKPAAEDWPRMDGRLNAEDDFEADEELGDVDAGEFESAGGDMSDLA